MKFILLGRLLGVFIRNHQSQGILAGEMFKTGFGNFMSNIGSCFIAQGQVKGLE